MRVRITLLVFIISFSVLAFTFATEEDDPWQTVGSGISYQPFHISTPAPIDIYVARMDRSNPNAILDSAVGQGRISYGTEKVTEMVKRYDDSINYWGGSWGNRSKVVVAINGSYFNGIGAPESGQIISGWYAKRFSDLSSSSGLAYYMNRTVSIGQCVNNDLSKQTLSIYRADQQIRSSIKISGVNVPRGANQLILYTPQYDVFTHTSSDGMEVLVEMTRPTQILPNPKFANGYVRRILDRKGATLIPFDHIILSASGSVREDLLAALKVGDEIQVSQEITSYDRDCESSYPMDWTKVYASISGDYTVLRAGKIQSSTQAGATIKNPRTVIAYNDVYIYFIVVDGRTQRSVGMTFDEVAAFAHDTLGASWAIMQDGGGSSVLVINGEIKNHPVSLCNAVFIPLIINGDQPPLQVISPTPPSPQPSGTATARPLASLYTCERPVANSMMMIDVQPAHWSLAYQTEDAIHTLEPTQIRLGPGSNYPAITSLPAGAQGVILPHAANLNGIEAKGAYWWKAIFGSIEGWVDENTISNH